jgi:ABC-type multidrug transport system fused ATPase/permease subunit
MFFARRFAVTVGAVGLAFFALAFLASIVSPGYVEQVAKNIIRYEVEKKVHEKVEAIDTHFLTKKAEVFAQAYTDDITRVRGQLAQQLPARIAEVVAQMRNLDCECRKKIETNIREGFEWRITRASAAQERLTTLIRSRYMETASQLTREFRIFTGTNAIVFALLLIAILFKRQAGLHLLPTAFVLLLAATVTAYLYLFNQNWLHTLVFSDFVGFAYIGYLGGAARVTTEVLNALFSAAGSAVQVVPC